jgi:hypothetical protein
MGLGPLRVTDGPSVEERAIKYLAKVPPAIAGQGGHDQTMDAARAMVWGFDLGAETGFRLLWEHYNPRCQPPWREKELRHKCQDADTKPFGKPRGWLLNEEKPIRITAPPAGPSPPCPLPGYEPFPLDVLPPTLREYVDASAAAIGCDPALVALPALAVAAGCIGNSRAVRIKKWTETAIVWSATVAGSGAGKSPGYAAAVDPLLEIQMEEVDAHQQRQREYEQKDKAGEEAEQPAPEKWFVTSEATIESVGGLLQGSPRGLLLARDELDGWFQGFTRYKKSGGTDRPHWLELARAGTLRIHRVSRPPLSVRRACCSITGTIQPAILAQALDREALAAGTGARFLMAMPPRRPRRWSEATVADELAKRYEDLLRSLLALPLADAVKRKPHVLELTPSAKAVFVPWFGAWGARQDAAQDAEQAALAKLEAYALRLALVHHVVAHVAVETDDIRPIGEQSIRAGICLAEWFADEALRVYQALRETDGQRRLRELAEWVAARGGEGAPWQVMQGLRRRYPSSADAEKDLEDLVKAGFGEWVYRPSGASGGRPGKFFRLLARKQENQENPPKPGGCDGGAVSKETPSDMQKPCATEGFPGFLGADSTNGEDIAGHGPAEVFSAPEEDGSFGQGVETPWDD